MVGYLCFLDSLFGHFSDVSAGKSVSDRYASRAQEPYLSNEKGVFEGPVLKKK